MNASHATCTDPIKFIISVRYEKSRKAHLTFYAEHQLEEVRVRIVDLETRMGLRKLPSHETLYPSTFSVGVVVQPVGIGF